MELNTDVADGQAFSRLHGTLDRGVGLPLGHSSLWIRTAAGYSPRRRSAPFANFFFGSFGNNYRIATGATVDPVKPCIFRGCTTSANS